MTQRTTTKQQSFSDNQNIVENKSIVYIIII